MPMFRKRIPVLLALALIGGIAPAVAAQDEGPLQFEDLEGIQKAYTRTYIVDTTAVSGAATPGTTSGGTSTLGAMVLEFNTEDHAAAGLDRIMAEIQETGVIPDDSPAEDVELDIDLDHVARRDQFEDGGVVTTALVAGAQDETTVVLVVGLVLEGDSAPLVGSILTEAVETEASDEPEIFSEDGTSEGGLWARLPGEVPGMVEAVDETLYPVARSPVATPARIEVTPETVSTPAG